MKIYAVSAIGTDGLEYSVRLILDQEELEGLQKAGVIGDEAEIVGTQDVADSLMAGLQKEFYTSTGGVLQ